LDEVAGIGRFLAASAAFVSPLDETGKMPVGQNAKPEDFSIKIGDLVQWTSCGVDMFASPQPVIGFSEDGEWAYVESSTTGLPVSELTIMAKNTETPDQKPSPKTPPQNPYVGGQAPTNQSQTPNQAQERTTLDEGPVLLQMPGNLSQESVQEFEYWMAGIIRRARRKAGLPHNGDKGAKS